ncbi:MAG: alpha/beta hydrolase [Kiloniellales bacterium]|nr:alpha/beta hydrolase [Kiloniellales bacterium]
MSFVQPPPDRLARPQDESLAYHRTAGRAPGIIFLGGFVSDMTGTKALALEAYARRRGQAFLRFDYQGHGGSSGLFEDGTIGRWAEDSIAAIDELTEGPQVLVGSSMGGWIMLLAALARPGRVAALLGIAAAPDFTEDLMWQRFPEEIKAEIESKGVYYAPSDYAETPYPLTKRLIEEGRRHLLLRGPIPLTCPIRLLQGMQDPDVPWETALRLAEALESRDVEVTLVKDGDHRLSDPADLRRLEATLDRLLDQLDGG